MKLGDTTVGARLAIGFSFVLVLLGLITGISLWRLHEARTATEQMVNVTMAKERLVSDWAASTNVNGARTIAVADSTNPELEAQVQKKIKETSAHISKLQKALNGFPKSPQEDKLFETISRERHAYLSARDEVFKQKGSNEDEAHKLVESKLEPALQEYVASIGKLTDYQSDSINKTRDEIMHLAATSQQLLIGLGVLALVMGMVVAFVIARSIRSQLGGEPAQAVEIANRIAQGDLAAAPEVRRGDTSSLMYAIKQMQENLARIVGEVRTSGELIASGSSEIATGNLDLSARTEQQAGSLEETAASMEELTSTVKQNAENARQANQLAASASTIAGEGGNVVAQVVAMMESINASSKRIVDIISVIDGIAFQTNILALNAAVEAARAGEQGRGFAVVASEVRNLAQRSASAAKDIQSLINDSVQKVEAGSGLANQAGETMRQAVASVKQVSDIVSEIAAASDEQRAGIEQVNSAISQMDQVTQQNAALVEQAAAAAGSLQEQAQRLAASVSVFKLDAGHAARLGYTRID